MTEPNNLVLVPPRWRTPARLFTLAITLAMLAFFIAGLPVRVQALSQPCLDPTDCPPLFLTAAELPALEALGWTIQGYALYQTALEVVLVAIFMLLVALIFSRLAHTVIGLVTCLALAQLAFASANVAFTLVEFYPAWRVPFYLLTTITGSALLLLIFLFPDGRFYPPAIRWLAWPLLAAGFIGQLASAGGNTGLDVSGGMREFLLAVAPLGGISFGLYSLVRRYRGPANPVQRQQIKWMILAGAASLVGILAWGLLFESGWIAPGWPTLLANVLGVLFPLATLAVLPLAIALGILRYRLWDLDLLIRRTATYALLTGVLTLAFFSGVALLQSLFVQLTGQESPLALVLSTLAIAALFNPLRRRFQAAIDRRFYRGRLDARLALEQFGDQLRSEVNLEGLSDGMLAAVQAALEPESLSLWIRDKTS